MFYFNNGESNIMVGGKIKEKYKFVNLYIEDG
jgi:hypothetical protein